MSDTVSKWIPTTDLLMLRRMGKLTEELGELQAVAGRCIIQGIDEIDPGSGIVNRERLEKELADVLAQCRCTIEALGLDQESILARAEHKHGLMVKWEALFGMPWPDSPAWPAPSPASPAAAKRRGPLERLIDRLFGTDDIEGWPPERDG